MTTTMNSTWELASVHTPVAHQGFLGPMHTARAVVQNEFRHSDPFILLMDDIIDFRGGEPIGAPHPHAGFETVTLVLEGEMGAGSHVMKTGDFQMMTAGSGVVHTETIEKATTVRILQLWLTLPRQHRWAVPRVQDLPLEHVPILREPGVEIRLYSGSLSGVTAPTHNYVPVIIADIHLQPNTDTVLELPGSFSAFLYAVEGDVTIGEQKKPLGTAQIGWLETEPGSSTGSISITAGAAGSRVVLYAGQPQRESIVPYGPFIGDTMDDIHRLFQEYKQGRMKHISTVPAEQQIAL
jgi:redox-sensitive bicupin YhaK (pirin superfamily)